MLLDETGFYGSPGNSNKNALLIISDKIAEHQVHTCVAHLWVYGGAVSLSHNVKLPLDQVFIASANEVTTDHLDRYKDKIMVLGVGGNLIGPCEHDTTIFSDAEVDKPIIGAITIPERFQFPHTVERLFKESRSFGAACVLDPYHLFFGNVDCTHSAQRNIVFMPSALMLKVPRLG